MDGVTSYGFFAHNVEPCRVGEYATEKTKNISCHRNKKLGAVHNVIEWVFEPENHPARRAGASVLCGGRGTDQFPPASPRYS